MEFTDKFLSIMEEELHKVFGVEVPDWAERTGAFEEAFYIACARTGETRLENFYENDLDMYGKMEFASSLVQKVKTKAVKRFWSDYPDMFFEHFFGAKLKVWQKIVIRMAVRRKKNKRQE